MIGLFFAASAEVLCAAGAAHTVAGLVLGRLASQLLTFLVTGIVIWIRRLERKDLLAADTLHDIVAQKELSLLVTDVLQHLLAECFTQVLRLHDRVALATAAVSEFTRRQLRQKCLFRVALEAVLMVLMEAAIC